MRPNSIFFDVGLNGLSLRGSFKKFKQENLKKMSTAIENYKKAREAKELTAHFCQFFNASIAKSASELDKCFRIRHEVYCEEMGYLPLCDDKLERTHVDEHSLHCTIQHKLSKHFAGTVRLVYTQSEDQKLPVEQFCINSITDTAFHPSNFPREEICEISRLAVPASFRRRKMDKFKNAATGGINEYEYSEEELRCFPFVAIGLYLAAGAAALRTNRSHVFVMMEPRLARNMQFVGISFKQIGETVNYHGKRAPYYINAHDFKRELKSAFKNMLGNIDQQLYHD
ncbi:PEP-CTERM/exosortase system-associated acyltransferase [Glaciecola siphonariae]|uniref:PEP-CTERM/exosortase system-associated acyltransferase n=1 Tax=Glaciecola siphonariae TaxID=521012 RepID=A0ABV9LWB1_9ALTE